MKNIKVIVLSLILGLGFSSCDSFLDVGPTSLTVDNFYKTESDLKSALVGVYAPLNYNEFYANFYPLEIAGGDDLTFYQRSNPDNNSIILANASSSTPTILTLWKALYEGINRANLLLENVDKNKEIAIEFRDKIRAEAKFMRGFYHFHLVQGWGDVPIVLQSTNSLGNHIFVKRDDKEKVYNQIIKDITESLPNLPIATNLSHTGTITQTAAKGILARVYLFRAGEHKRDNKSAGSEVKKYYEEALKWALEVKSSGLHMLAPSYSQVFIDYSQDIYNSQGMKESMWEAEMYGQRETAVEAAGRIGNTLGFGSTTDYSQSTTLRTLTGMKNPGYSYRFAYASLKLYEMYELEGDKMRGDWNIAPFEYNYATTGEKEVIGRNYFYGKKPSGLNEVEGMPCVELAETHALSKAKTRCVAKYRREYEILKATKNKNWTPINFPILRYSDVLLMLAEAENEVNGPTALAYECINDVRKRAKIAELSGLSKEDFLEAVKKERAMELCFEALRRWDLIRWGEYFPYMKGMEFYVAQDGWGSGHKYAANYYKVTSAYNYFPIPDVEIGNNSNLVQNTGW